MQLSHTLSATSVLFDDPNLVSSVGLVPVLALARRCGLHDAAAVALSVPSANASVKATAVVAGMVVGADSIDDLDRLRHGGMGRLFGGIRAPSTLGTFLRSFTFGHVNSSIRSVPRYWSTWYGTPRCCPMSTGSAGWMSTTR